jgi:TIR domain
MAYEPRIFISHHWRAQTDYYRGLRGLLEEANFKWRNLAVPPEHKFDGELPMDRVLEKLRTADVVLVVNTRAVGASPNVKRELEEAVERDIPIIAVRPHAKHRVRRLSRYRQF